MPRPKQPIDLITAKGKKHLTKQEIENRKAHEVQARSDKIKAPSYLSKKGKKEFKKIAKELKAIGIMTNLDVDALARFIIARELYVQISQKLIGDPDILIRDKNMLANQNTLFKQCRSAASDLGLTISSRCKLVMPKTEDNEPENKFQKFM
jgi:P27 family predicted phage terminase small subunit|uniref:Terminase small subunit n=1 Tax=Siphoviridae sp. ctOb14 TaxID=2827862 RepID=A0A8S5SLM8_9CAUD|nr:MAG TPA: terminase small subunit [Siphoviridae sp. ctOb14]